MRVHLLTAAAVAAGLVAAPLSPRPAAPPWRPFQRTIRLTFPEPAPGDVSTPTASFPVPTGKCLVIEYVTRDADLGAPMLELTTTVGGNEATYRLEERQQAVRLYADGGTTVRLASTFSMATHVDFTLSGQLVDAPR